MVARKTSTLDVMTHVYMKQMRVQILIPFASILPLCKTCLALKGLTMFNILEHIGAENGEKDLR